MSTNIEQITAMLERAGKTNLSQEQKIDLDKERLQLEATANIEKIDKELEEAAEKYQSDARRHVLDNTPIGTAKDAFIAGAQWQEKRNEETIKTAEDHAFLAGADWQLEKIIKLIQSRIGEILGDAQPKPVLRAELRELIEKIKENEK